tara:strand:- start:2702 stop:3031 length:330 start_codon:yes stop_codon:yes gene_type:complete
MRKKVNFRILKEITLNELNGVTGDNIWLCDLVEQVANKYSKTMPAWNLTSRNYRKIKQCDMMISNIAKNNGWGSKQKRRENNFYKVEGMEKILVRVINSTLLYRLQEEE